jgi:hypothetical protein
MKLSEALKQVENGKTIHWSVCGECVHEIKVDENGDVLIQTIETNEDPAEQTILPNEGWEVVE